MGLKITKTNLLLLGIFVLALVLRIIAASHVVMSADELVYASIPINIISAGRLSTVYQQQLYFYVADLGYQLMGGVTPIATRLPAIIFGSFAVFVIFALARDLFSSKVGLISAFLFAVSGYAVRYNFEADMAAFFFGLSSVLFFLRWLWESKNKNLYLSSLFLALGVSMKNILLLFVPAYVIVWLFMRKRAPFSAEKLSMKNSILPIVLGILIFLVVLSPIFAYNYILYKEKGITDFYFSTILGVGKNAYQGLENRSWSIPIFSAKSAQVFMRLFNYDGPLILLGFLGMFLSFRKKMLETLFLFLTMGFLFAYLAGVTGSPSHYLWIPLILSIFAGHCIVAVHEKITQRWRLRHFIPLVLTLIFVFNVIFIWDVLSKKDAVLALREYVHNNIPEEAIVILDPRVYRGIYAWAFNDKHYLEGTAFPQLKELLEKSTTSKVTIPIYYIECGKGTTCIWSTEDYERVNDFGKQLTDYFRNNTEQVAQVTGKAGVRDTFVVYHGAIAAPVEIYEAIDRTHIFWFYPVGWKYTDDVIDNYEAKGFHKILNSLGFVFLYIDFFTALLSLPFVLFLLRKQQEVTLYE